MQQISGKGILRRASDFRLLGIRAPLLGVAYFTIVERRLLEALVSGVQLVIRRAFPTKVPDRPTAVRIFTQRYFRYRLEGGEQLIARAEAICRIGDARIACEYGQPGHRILVESDRGRFIQDPYDDAGVWHLHAIVPLDDRTVAITTGDSAKYLDIYAVGRDRCRFVRRLKRRLAGYTAMAVSDGRLWCGSDFSERANYLLCIEDGKKYYLPADSIREYVIHLADTADGLLVVTRRLHRTTGHALLFSTDERRFVASNPISVLEVVCEAPERDADDPPG